MLWQLASTYDGGDIPPGPPILPVGLLIRRLIAQNANRCTSANNRRRDKEKKVLSSLCYSASFCIEKIAFFILFHNPQLPMLQLVKKYIAPLGIEPTTIRITTDSTNH